MKAQDILDRLEREQANRQLRRQIRRIEEFVTGRESGSGGDDVPVLFFNASTRIHRLSINAAYSLLSSWRIRLAEIPVYYATCTEGMVQCILGTNREDYQAPPLCKHCVPFSNLIFPNDRLLPITMNKDLATSIAPELQDKSLQDLSEWEYDELPLGELCLPGLRWALRRHHLPDDEPTRSLYRQYLTSAANLAEAFGRMLDDYSPRALVLFNGITYPEAVARKVAQRAGIHVVTHEVGLRPYSAFFSHSDATIRNVDLTPDYVLSKAEDDRLNTYLEDRFRGQFTMAGIHFWPEMTSIPEALQEQMAGYSQIVPIFTNVIFDTSQIHANVIFDDMFAWLDDIQDVVLQHPETLFIIRAHPDEDRPGKESRESVSDWFQSSRLREAKNVIFYPPSEYISSYELIRDAKFVMVYNSSIGLEASLMGVAVLCAGRARYTQIPTTYFPSSRSEYLDYFERFLISERVNVPSIFIENARRFLNYELYYASLDLSEFLKPYPRTKGMVLFEDFEPESLQASQSLEIISDGILQGKPFVMT